MLDSHNGVVFLLDISGSMYEPCAGSTRLMFARQALSQRIRALKDGTPFAITLYAQIAHNSGPLVAASDATREAAVRFIMEDFDCGGGTNLPAGLASAQQLHAGHIVLASDGDLNISPTNLLVNARNILGPEGHCPALTVINISPRLNTDAESLLQSLADQQGGNCLTIQSDDAIKLLTSNKTEVTTP
jgi:Mg-chelatase subunit ChlD